MPKRKGVRNRGKNEDEKAKKKKKTTPSKCIEPPASISEDENSIGSVEDMMTQDDECNDVTVEEGGANFLTRLDLKESTRGKRSKKKLEKRAKSVLSSEEAGYEKTPRSSGWDVKKDTGEMHYLLPLKAKHGLIQQAPTQVVPINCNEEADDPEESDGSIESPLPHAADIIKEPEGSQNEDCPPTRVLTTVELFARCEEKLTEKKETIATVTSQLLENPEGNIGHLKKLRTLCAERDPDVASTVRKLAMVSFVDIFKDIAPSYHIRELTELEKGVKVSKDVRSIRHFEHTLLLDYQIFLSQCDETIRVGLNIRETRNEGKKRRGRREKKRPLILLDKEMELSQSAMKSLGEVSLMCLCDLLVSLPHFNFRNNILATLVPLMPSKALNGKVSQMCCSGIESVFQNDGVGDVSYEAVQLIAKMVKAKSYKTKPAVLLSFLHLHLEDVDVPVAAPGTTGRGRTKEERKRDAKQKSTKKQKRRQKAEAMLDRDLQETSAVESKEKRTKTQTEILKVVFLTYFRILKHSLHSPLLQSVLEGLAKFAHLINIDFFADLMSVLHSLAETGGLSNKECMQCVLTAFEILSGQGSILNIDPREFYTQLYGALLQLDAASSDGDVLLAVDCLDKLLRNHRQVSVQRVLGFVKRLATMTLQLLPGAVLAVLATLKKFVQSYSQCEQLLDVEAMAGSGVYRPDVPDPEMSFSSSTSLWELADLRMHYEPSVVAYASHLLHGAPSQGRHNLRPTLARKSPRDLLSELSLNFHGTKSDSQSKLSFDPMDNVPLPPPHPALILRAHHKKKDYYYSDSEYLSVEMKEKVTKALEVDIKL